MPLPVRKMKMVALTVRPLSVLVVVVADARYRLPDGREGRTSASFAVGLPNGDGLEPFAVEVPSGLYEDVEARLHGEPQRS